MTPGTLAIVLAESVQQNAVVVDAAVVTVGKNEHLTQTSTALEGLVHNGNGVIVAAGVDDLHMERHVRVDELFALAHRGLHGLEVALQFGNQLRRGGLVAAKAAADNGAKVVIVEKCEEGKAVCPLWMGGFAA